MDLGTPERIRELQRKLYVKAKSEPNFRFYALYDKVYRPDILKHAYAVAKANRGASGVDGITFEEIEKAGLEGWLKELGRELREESYRPQAVRRVMIPKPGGGERPLGIPTIKDRVVQTAAKIVIEPIFEADLEDNTYGYRPKRGAQDAIKHVHEALKAGYTDVVDADLSKYFDTIPHRELLRTVAKRIVDKRVLRLIEQWLKAPVETKGEDGKSRMSGGKGSNRGTPQGGVISPLLANVYINRMLRCFRERGVGERLRAQIVSYADDFVILTKGRSKEALEWVKWAINNLGLTLNLEKTKLKDARKELFDFLGYSFGMVVYTKTGKRYMTAKPSAKSLSRIREKIRKVVNPRSNEPIRDVARRANHIVRGWCNYFSYGSTYMAYRALHNHIDNKVRRLLVRRHRVKSRGIAKFPEQDVFGSLGFLNPFVMKDLRRSMAST